MDKFVRRYDQVDINLVMGTGSGLLTPIIRDVGSRGLKSISKEVEALEDSLFLESGEVDAGKMAVGTFSIHNLGEISDDIYCHFTLTPSVLIYRLHQ